MKKHNLNEKLDIIKILETKDPVGFLYEWSKNHTRLSPDYEKLLAEMSNPAIIFHYIKIVVKKRVPELEKYITKDKGWWANYLNLLENIRNEETQNR
jgi:hypothetical protein